MPLTEKREYRRVYLAFLVIATIGSWWYPWRALTSLASYGGGGIFNGGGYGVYIFTYLGTGLSLILTALFVLRQTSRGEWYLALLVAYVSTIVTTNWYEQVWSGLGVIFRPSEFQWWYQSHATGDQIFGTVGGLVWIAVIYPFVTRRGIRFSVPMWVVCGTSFALWVYIGFQLPNESTGAFVLNASTRISSQLIPSFMVYKRGEGVAEQKPTS